MHEKAFDLVIGSILAVVGSTGAAVQLWGDIGSLFLIGLNVMVAFGGMWLVVLRIKIAKRDLAGKDKPPPDVS